MKQKKSDKDVSRRPKGWAMSVANQLRWHKGFTPGEAVRQAYKVQNCLKALGKGVVKFSYYEKKDGSLRQAVGTLCKGVSAAYDRYEYKGKGEKAKNELPMTFCYWDLDEEGFRSFNAARLDDYLVTQKEDFNKVTQIATPHFDLQSKKSQKAQKDDV